MPESDPAPILNEAEMRMTAGMRLILVVSALAVVIIDPIDPSRQLLTIIILALYSLYSAAIYALVLARARIMHTFRFWTHWADIVWYLGLIALGSETNNIFFMFFFFSIVVASFRWGFKLGLWTAVISSILFSVVGYWTSRSDPGFELNRFLIRPIFLLVLGDMIAYRGGFEIILQRRIALLKEINILSNPRFGIDHTIASNMERVRAFYNADSCLFVKMEQGNGGHSLRRVLRKNLAAAERADPAPAEFSRRLLAPPDDHALLRSTRRFWFGLRNYYEYDVVKGQRVVEDRVLADGLAGLLDSRHVMTVPVRYHGKFVGRLYLTAAQSVFRNSDIVFLLQAIDQIVPVLDNIKLVDRLAINAAEEERLKIARDIHDSVIQPYLGLQIGLSALEQKLLQMPVDTPGGRGRENELRSVIASRIRQLREMTDEGIADLRRYISNLKESGGQEGNLLPAVRRFAARFSDATGIVAQVESEETPDFSDRLAAEVFQIVAEGLSNIQRHTQSGRAMVRMACSSNKLCVRIENDGPGAPGPAEFTPRSITERARSLQGTTFVEKLQDGGTAVVVEIPL